MIEGTIALITDVGDASKLTLDPDLDSYYLMNVLVFQGPELSELVAQARGLGTALIAGGTRTPDQLDALNRLSVLVGFCRSKVDESFGKALTANEALKPQLEAESRASAAAVDQAIAATAKLAAQPAAAASDAAELLRRPDPERRRDFRHGGRRDSTPERRCSRRASRAFQREVLETLAWAGLGPARRVGHRPLHHARHHGRPRIGRRDRQPDRHRRPDAEPRSSSRARTRSACSAQAFDRMVAALKEMVGVAERIAAGDLAVTVTPRSERDVLGHALANMVERLSTLVGEVQRSGIQVNTSVTEIAATAKQQQATASEIAATTTEIGATSREISATSKELVRTMNEVSDGGRAVGRRWRAAARPA